MSILKKRTLKNVLTDDDSSKKVKTDFKLHNFKKKKLKLLHDDSKKNKFLSVLEDLLSHKKEWQEDHVESLFSIMHDHFEVVNIYGYQIQNAILDYIDVANSDKSIQLAALCLSRFASIKKSNGTVLLQNILSTFLKLGKDYFDFFNIPSNLNEIKYPFKECLFSFSELIISDDDYTILQLVKRIKFLIYVTDFVFETNYDMNINVPFENLIKTIIGFLSTTPKELIDFSKKIGVQAEIPFYVNIHVWRLFQNLLIIPEFRGLFFDFIPKICEIIRLCLSEDLNNTPQLYVSNILTFLSCLLTNEARYCLPTVSCLIQILSENVARISSRAHSNKHEPVVTLYLQVINRLISFYHDKSIQKCVNTFAYEFSEIKRYLSYLENKSIFCTLTFLFEYRLFVKLTNRLSVVNDSRIETLPFNCFRFEQEINFEQNTNVSENQLSLSGNEQLTENVDEFVEKDSSLIENTGENIQKTIDLPFETEENSISNQQEENVERNVEECIEFVTMENRSGEIETHEQELSCDVSEQLQFGDKIINLEEMLMSFVPY